MANGLPATSIKDLGTVSVKGPRLLPSPPARMATDRFIGLLPSCLQSRNENGSHAARPASGHDAAGSCPLCKTSRSRRPLPPSVCPRGRRLLEPTHTIRRSADWSSLESAASYAASEG